MKKRSLFFISAMLFILVGCSTDEQKMLTCRIGDVSSGENESREYKIYYTGDYLDKIQITSIFTGEWDYLQNMKEAGIKAYDSQNNDYGGFVYDYEILFDTLTEKITIDYTKVNVKKYFDDNPSSIGELNSDKTKITWKSAKKEYEKAGATCE